MTEHGGDIYRNKVNKDYSVNISPYGIPPMVRAAVNEALLDISSYPDPLYEELRNAIGKADGQPTENIICGNGASEVIFAAVRALSLKISGQRKASIFAPSFSGYEKALLAALFDINKVSLKEEKAFIPDEDDINRLINNTNLVIIANPNNPTGRLLNKQWLVDLLKAAEDKDVFVILDETFLTLTDKQSYYDDISSDKLIRIRAYTKSMALPGIRLGYLICENNELIKRIKEQLPDWNVSLIAAKAGLDCANSKSWLETRVIDSENGLKTLRESMVKKLQNLPIRVYESDTNFLLIKSEIDLYNKVLNKGILIRSCGNFDGLSEDYYRISIKSSWENDYLYEALKDLFDNNADKNTEKDTSLVTTGDLLENTGLLAVKPAEIEKTSFNIISEELSAKGIILEDEKAQIIKRCIHTSADFSYASTLEFSDGAVEVLKNLIREGALIVTDTNMALSGINKTELKKYGVDALCFMSDERIAEAAKRQGCTRASASMEYATTLGRKTIFVIGNAPTALVTLCQLMDSKNYRPDFVIGLPVGFVNVVKAKEMIMSREINYIVNRGRKGGSNVAAAIINAVLYSMRDE